MAEYARKYAESQAAPGALSTLSSAEYFSCALPPMIESDDLNEHLSRTPLHITLGLGTNYLNILEAECAKLDLEWATYVPGNNHLYDYLGALQEAVVAANEVEAAQTLVDSTLAGMAICKSADPKCDRKGSDNPANPAHVSVIRYRLKREGEGRRRGRSEAGAQEARGDREEAGDGAGRADVRARRFGAVCEALQRLLEGAGDLVPEVLRGHLHWP